MLDKAIEHKKEKRKQYRGAKAVSRECRNHGSCAYCRNNRLFSRRLLKPREITEAYYDYWEDFYSW